MAQFDLNHSIKGCYDFTYFVIKKRAEILVRCTAKYSYLLSKITNAFLEKKIYFLNGTNLAK